MELFKSIAGFPNYQVSNQGRVRSRNKVLAQHLDAKGYLVVGLYAGGKKYTKKIHRLVAMSFIPGDHSLTVNHKDGCKVNNVEDNLEWMTQDNNMRHACNTGLCPGTLTDAEQSELFADYLTYGHTQQALADKYGIGQSSITQQLKTLRPSRPSQPRRAVAAHGTANMYNKHGCRCTLCRAADRAYRAKRKLDAHTASANAMIQYPLHKVSGKMLCK